MWFVITRRWTEEIPEAMLKCFFQEILITAHLYHMHSSTGCITSTGQTSNTKDGLDKSNCRVTRKQKTALPSQVSPVKHKPKQKHTSQSSAFTLKSRRNRRSLEQFGGNLELSGSVRPGRWERAKKHIERLHSSCRMSLSNHLCQRQLERRSACHFAETNTLNLSSPGRSFAALCPPKNEFDWRDLMCHPVCVVLRRVITTICSKNQSHHATIPHPNSNPPPHLLYLPLSLSLCVSMVQCSHRVHVSW